MIQDGGLLHKIRFPFMSALFLADEARGLLASRACWAGGAGFGVCYAQGYGLSSLGGKGAVVS